MLEMLMGLANAMVDEKIGSKLDGNKNWLIATETINGQLRIRYAGRAGAGDRFCQCLVSDIGKYNYRWFWYTYKKDYKHDLQLLVDNGAELPWYRRQ